MTDLRMLSTMPVARRAFSLLEVIAVVVLAGVIAAFTMMRYVSNDKGRIQKDACGANKGEIELQTQLWYRTKAAWPLTNLSDIGAQTKYFPKGLPVCPVDGSAYTIDATTHQVTGHIH